MFKKIVYDWFELLIKRDFNKWIKKKFTKKEAVISYTLSFVLVGVLAPLILFFGGFGTYLELLGDILNLKESIGETLLWKLVEFVGAFIFIWILPVMVKFYKVKKMRYDLFTNFLRLSAFITLPLTLIMVIGAIFFSLIGLNSFVVLIGFVFILAIIILEVLLINRIFNLSYFRSVIALLVTGFVVLIMKVVISIVITFGIFRTSVAISSNVVLSDIFR